MKKRIAAFVCSLMLCMYALSMVSNEEVSDEALAGMIRMAHSMETIQPLLAKVRTLRERTRELANRMRRRASRHKRRFDIDTTEMSKKAIRLQARADAIMNHQNGEGATLLMSAAGITGSSEVVEALLKEGAQVNTKDNQGYTALMRTVLTQRSDIARVLIEYGADMIMRFPVDELTPENVRGKTIREVMFKQGMLATLGKVGAIRKELLYLLD